MCGRAGDREGNRSAFGRLPAAANVGRDSAGCRPIPSNNTLSVTEFPTRPFLACVKAVQRSYAHFRCANLSFGCHGSRLSRLLTGVSGCRPLHLARMCLSRGVSTILMRRITLSSRACRRRDIEDADQCFKARLSEAIGRRCAPGGRNQAPSASSYLKLSEEVCDLLYDIGSANHHVPIRSG